MKNQAVDITLVLKKAILAIKPEMETKIEEITTELSLFDIGIDSIEFYEMVGFVEDSLNISLPNELLGDVKTIGDLKRIISEQVST